jgi:hypothetical protein
MKFKENDIFKLNIDIPENGLQKGAIGTVLQDIESTPQGYEVEFVDEEGYTIAQIYLLEKFMDFAEP